MLINKIISFKSKNIVWISNDYGRGSHYVPIGPLTVAGYVDRNYQHNLNQFLWLFNQDYDLLQQHIKETLPDFICFSIALDELGSSLELATQIINEPFFSFDKSKMVFGNRGVTNLSDAEQILSVVPDGLVVRYEGEASMLGLLKGNSRKEIPNLIYFKNQNLKIAPRTNFDTRQYVAPLLNIDMLDGNAYPFRMQQTRSGMIEDSRGCAKEPHCSFCGNSIDDNKKLNRWRKLPLSEILKNIENHADIMKKGKYPINIPSEHFRGGSQKLLNKFLDGLEVLKNDGKITSNITFNASFRVIDIYCEKDNEELRQSKIAALRRMKKLGFTSFFLGIESGSDSQLERYQKGTTANENIQAIKILRDLGLNVECGLIMFDPLMSIAEFKENIVFLEKQASPRLKCRVFSFIDLYSDTKYSRLFDKLEPSLPKKNKRFYNLLKNYLYPLLDINKRNVFLEELRTEYWISTPNKKIRELENIANSYGGMCIDFLKDYLVFIEENSSEEEIKKALDVFAEQHNNFLVKIIERESNEIIEN